MAPQSNRPASVYVLDDVASDLYAMQRTLTLAGFKARGSATAVGAMRDLMAEQADVLLTDIALPQGLSGFDVARAVQARYPHIKLVFITAYDVPPGGPKDAPVLRKPVTSESLVAHIAAVLGKPN